MVAGAGIERVEVLLSLGAGTIEIVYYHRLAPVTGKQQQRAEAKEYSEVDKVYSLYRNRKFATISMLRTFAVISSALLVVGKEGTAQCCTISGRGVGGGRRPNAQSTFHILLLCWCTVY